MATLSCTALHPSQLLTGRTVSTLLGITVEPGPEWKLHAGSMLPDGQSEQSRHRGGAVEDVRMRLGLELGPCERAGRHADHETSPGIHAGGEVVRRVARGQDTAYIVDAGGFHRVENEVRRWPGSRHRVAGDQCVYRLAHRPAEAGHDRVR